MSGVYASQDLSTIIPMSRVHCKDEEKELQLLLENNPDLLPGRQIKPEDPRRWLLIKREMPVPDPSSDSDRWSIDLGKCSNMHPTALFTENFRRMNLGGGRS